MLANPRNLKTSLNENQSKIKKSVLDKPKQENNKIKVFTIKRKDETTLIKRTYMVDLLVAIPYFVKDLRGPKKLWVPKSA